MPSGTLRRVAITLALTSVLTATACAGRGVFAQEFEYEEEIYLQLDGSATAYVNASVPALVSLRGAQLNVDPRSRPERDRLRALFAAPGARVTTPTFSRRNGRRFVHVRVDVDDVRQLARLAPFAWSTYHFDRRGDVFVYQQHVGKAAGKDVGNVGWTGNEMVSFKMHLPSEIPFNNSPKPVQRGNILQWQQPLAERLSGTPVDIEAHLQPESILYTTLTLFAGTIVAAALTFAVIIWWVARRGRAEQLSSST